jgi:hypothetical protein
MCKILKFGDVAGMGGVKEGGKKEGRESLKVYVLGDHFQHGL